MATASLALNGSKIVAQKTRKRILSLADSLNYQPNLVARSLAGGSNQLIGVLVDSRAPRILFRLLTYIEKEAAQYGYRIIIGEAHDNVEHFREIHQTLRRYNTDGIICLAHDYPGQEEEFRRVFDGARNMVFVGRPKLDIAAYVDIDRSLAIRNGVEHLLSQGYRKIGMVCNSLNYISVTSKVTLFKDVIQTHGIAPEDTESMIYRVPNKSREEGVVELCEKWIIPGHCDGIFVENDVWAAMICKYLQKKGLSAPRDIGIIGSDNDEFCTYTSPELSTIDDEQELQAACAVKMLMELLSDKKNDRISRSMTIQSRLVVRESSFRDISTDNNFNKSNKGV